MSIPYRKKILMDKTPISMAESFYTTMGQKNVGALEKYLHSDIELITPLSKLQGKTAYFEAVKNFVSFFEALTIRAKFANENQAMLVIDLDCPEPVGNLPTASLLTFQEGLISKIEIFHDTSPFQKVKNDLLA